MEFLQWATSTQHNKYDENLRGLSWKGKKHNCTLLLCYLCNVRPAWSRDGCTLRTGHKGSPPGHGPSRKAVSTATSGRGGSSCSGSSSPCGAPCPCLWAGTSPCSASSFAGLHPVVATHSIWHDHLSLSFIIFQLFYISTSAPVWSVSGEVWGCPAGSTDWAWCCPAEAAYSADTATHHQEPAEVKVKESQLTLCIFCFFNCYICVFLCNKDTIYCRILKLVYL